VEAGIAALRVKAPSCVPVCAPVAKSSDGGSVSCLRKIVIGKIDLHRPQIATSL